MLRAALPRSPLQVRNFLLPADQIVKATGQEKPSLAALLNLKTDKGYIQVNANFETSIARRICGGRLHPRARGRFHRDGRARWQTGCAFDSRKVGGTWLT